ncbi:MAG TPA: hypothetical protein DIW66_02435 [Serratia liquefaciens]|jgi:hypothetical protein|nr:hypothetical protein [Serratia liquefaciens]
MMFYPFSSEGFSRVILAENRMTFVGHIAQSVGAAISVILKAASLLAAFSHPSHIVDYAPGDSLRCRRDATSMI